MQLTPCINQETTNISENRTAELLENSSMNQWRRVKGVENPADIGILGMSIECYKESVWLNGLAWLQRSEYTWPKSGCQVNELESEHASSTVATKIKLDQLFDLRRYRTLTKFEA